MISGERCVVISTMLMCNAGDFGQYDRVRLWLSSAPLNTEYDNNGIER